MSIVVTGATGHLGRLVVDDLLTRGVPASTIVATGRHLDGVAGLAERGVEVRQADFADTGSLSTAFAGADVVLVVSTTDVGQRAGNHRRAIDAAKAARVARIVYTSALNADTASMRLAEEHHATEDYLQTSGVAHTILRNGWYLENYLDQLPMTTASGAVFGAAGEGRVSAASRADYAAAAATVLLDDVHADRTYDLGGDEAFTLTELAAVLSQLTGNLIGYTNLGVAQYAAALRQAGLPDVLAEVLADADAGLARGELYTQSTDLHELIGRPTTRLVDAAAAALQALGTDTGRG